MKEVAGVIHYRPLRAPANHGEALIDPPVIETIAWLQQHSAARQDCQSDLQGQQLSQLRSAARAQMLRDAQRYTQQYRDIAAAARDQDARVILAGHQPQLVHPGVWYKNFFLSELGDATSSHVVNLLIDNDAVHSTALHVPTGSLKTPRVTSIPFDRTTVEVPFEERRILDRDCFRYFGKHVAETIRPLVRRPLMRDFWPLAIEAAQQRSRLGTALAQARHVLEERFGLNSLELPLSYVCRSHPFRWFACHLLAHAAELRTIHNDSLREYRQTHRLRSHSHPVPDLTSRDGWIEVPFWIWHSEHPQRRAAFVRRVGSAMELTDFAAIRTRLELSADRDLDQPASQLEQLEEAEIRLRPRALITTMFARLVLSDLFIHGIGGAKYDQVTDAIIQRFFGIEPPLFQVISATFRLPLGHASIEARDVTRVDQLLRELRYHPECHVDVTDASRPWIQQKLQAIQDAAAPNERRARHLRIEQANQELQPYLQRRYQQLAEQRESLRAALRAAAVLDSREYSFCLFPEESLVPQLKALAHREP
jgi:hypothetical protein